MDGDMNVNVSVNQGEAADAMRDAPSTAQNQQPSTLWRTPSRRKRPRVQDSSLDQSQSSDHTPHNYDDDDSQDHHQDVLQVDINTTPRAPVSFHPPSARPARPRPSSTWSASASASTSTSTTGEGNSKSTGSPRKKLRNLGIRDDGIEARAFRPGDPDLPRELVDIWARMVQASKGVGVISPTQKDKIEEMAHSSLGGIMLPQQMQYMYALSCDERDQLGPTPSIDDAMDLVNWAIECQDRNAEEAAWNSSIHSRLLSLALYKDGRFRSDCLVGFSQWQVEHPPTSYPPSGFAMFTLLTFPRLLLVLFSTSATIIPQYTTANVATKKVDFCLHLNPRNDPVAGDAAAQQVSILRRTLPCNSISHTDLDELSLRPITASIETKRLDGARPGESHLQIGTWHAAQWRLLEDLTRQGRRDFSVQAGSGGSHELEQGQESHGRLPLFLPAVVINGHDWSFAATTRKGRKTVRLITPSKGAYSVVLSSDLSDDEYHLTAC
ncbi:hypothetical protein SLS53_009231 [Cytospora paraplurivora]|uniref:PD-(D/E)XK nuclease-like domain-containing protein n=1 Tax=Cytospora paraplurivora TaxID=2898453 RepID=A0AAN9YC43_9PEZI